MKTSETAVCRHYHDEINEIYLQILRRPVDPSGLKTYSNLMASGKLSRDGLVQVLRASEEFALLLFEPERLRHFDIDSTPHLAEQKNSEVSSRKSNRACGPVAASIVSMRYIADARVTARSFRRYHPDIPFVVLLTDAVDDSPGTLDEPFESWRLGDIGIPSVERFIFQYTELEACYAATPFFVHALLAAGYDRVIFFKRETLVLGGLEDLYQGLGTTRFFVTPHLLEPAGEVAREVDTLRAGIFNCGVFGASDTIETREFLRWWMERTYRNCYQIIEDGLHYEQRWLDFLPSMIPGVSIVRDPGINVAHWNLSERRVGKSPDGYTAQGRPLRIFRFSGYDPDRPERVSCHSDLRVRETGEAEGIFRMYHAKLVDAGLGDAMASSYAYGAFDNGVRIPNLARRMYRDQGIDVARFGNPRLTAGGRDSFYHWLTQPATPDIMVSRLWQAVYEQEPAIQWKFPRIDDILDPAFGDFWSEYDGLAKDIPTEFFPSAWARA